MSIKDAVKLTQEAVKWYSTPSHSQYDDGPLEVYDEAARRLTEREALASALVDFVGKTSGEVLEVAAGSGLVTKTLSEAFPGMKSVDLSHEALSKLQSRTKKALVAAADFNHLPFADAGFELVVDVGGYRYVKDPDIFWQEIARVLKPGGRYVVVQFHPRLSKMKGRNISEELEEITAKNNFVLSRTAEFSSSVKMNTFSVNSGQYKIFEFKSTKPETPASHLEY